MEVYTQNQGGDEWGWAVFRDYCSGEDDLYILTGAAILARVYWDLYIAGTLEMMRGVWVSGEGGGGRIDGSEERDSGCVNI